MKGKIINLRYKLAVWLYRLADKIDVYSDPPKDINEALETAEILSNEESATLIKGYELTRRPDRP